VRPGITSGNGPKTFFFRADFDRVKSAKTEIPSDNNIRQESETHPDGSVGVEEQRE
jgi:hypothetical protein